MIEVFVIENINYVLRRLETDGYNEEIWTIRDIRRRTGIKYGYIYSMECLGIIEPVSRTNKGRLIWEPREVYEMLKRIRARLSKRIKHYE